MPIQPTYPGVYIEEIPSGVRTITGVATSITAFIGKALRGPLDIATVINNFGDYDRRFGGLWADSMMSYAVRDFYQNGGGRAVIVRIANNARFTTITLPTSAGPPLVLISVNPGKWGENLKASVDYKTRDTADATLYNLTIKETGGATETFLNLSTNPASPRFPTGVLEQTSALVRVSGNVPAVRPLETIDLAAKPANDIDLLNAASEVVLRLRPVDALSGVGLKATVTPAVPAAPNLFNLTITNTTGASEPFTNVSLDKDDAANFVVVKLADSELVKVVGPVVNSMPAEAAFNATETNNANGYELSPDLYIGSVPEKSGLAALLNAEFNLLCIPPHQRDDDTHATIFQSALGMCLKKRAMLIVDPPANWGISSDNALETAETVLSNLGLSGSDAKNAALYFPRVKQSDPERLGQIGTFVPCGIVAGVMARTDSTRGVWKSPAGLDASLNGVQGLQVNLTDDENGFLNPLGINCLRQFPVTGRVVWGARTLRGADQLADTDNKYVAVRRMSLFLEESLYRATQWVVFEPNDEPLWSQIRLNIGAFMQNLFIQGAFQGKTPREAYLVKCDPETTTQTDINLGVVNVLVGFAPLKPAEFVFIKIQQLSAQTDI
jgi:phage tail sheath protein FI